MAICDRKCVFISCVCGSYLAAIMLTKHMRSRKYWLVSSYICDRIVFENSSKSHMKSACI